MLKRLIALAAIAAVAVAVTSCGTQTSLVRTSWELPGQNAGPYQKIVVIAAARDQTHGDALENAVVDQLEKDGVDGVPGHTIMKHDVDMPLEKMQKIVEGTNADAVMVVKVIGMDADFNYTPPTTYVTTGAPYAGWWSDPYWGYYNPYPYHYWGYWYPAAQVTSTPGYWSRSVSYRIETALYRTTDNHLVWTATSKTYNPDDEYDLGSSMARRITARMERVGLIES